MASTRRAETRGWPAGASVPRRRWHGCIGWPCRKAARHLACAKAMRIRPGISGDLCQQRPGPEDARSRQPGEPARKQNRTGKGKPAFRQKHAGCSRLVRPHDARGHARKAAGRAALRGRMTLRGLFINAAVHVTADGLPNGRRYTNWLRPGMLPTIEPIVSSPAFSLP